MYLNPNGLVLKVITEKVDSSAVRHPNGKRVVGSFVVVTSLWFIMKADANGIDPADFECDDELV